ncbi:PorP/SprF family type IX secretion system membrane protein, partial [Neotamlana laminarinivorans]
MKKLMPYMFFTIFFVQHIVAQNEDGVVAFQLPVRNGLRFNKFNINPTFSFVREQNKYISITNKREWVGFTDAPQTYLFSYNGRFKENIGAGVSLFQQNYGVMTTFGGVLNMAYNAVISRNQNLTFGINLGAYSSGLNEGNVVINFDDPSLQNIQSNTVISINPGINYGTTFLDFGVSLNNIVAYNFTTSKMLEDNPEQSIQGHIMYTGYMDSRGFFDESKFTAFARTELKKETTVVSGIVMLTVPKGIWGQVGYNTLYGASGGIGFNITNTIAVEYNYEKAIGDLASFGSSHELTLAYKFKDNNRFLYSGDDDEEALLKSNKRKSSSSNRKPKAKTAAQIEAERAKRIEAAAQRKAEAEAKAEQRRIAAAKAKEEAEAKRLELEAQQKRKVEQTSKAEQERLAAEAKSKAEAEAEAKRLAQERAEAEAAAAKAEQERLAAEAKSKAEAEAEAKRLAQERAEAEAAAAKAEQERLAAEAKSKAEAEAEAKRLAQERAEAEAAAAKAEQERLAAEAKSKAEAEAEAKRLAQERAEAEAAAAKA